MFNREDSQIILSIIIPIYNTSKYLEESLESVFTQLKSNIEVILINDGSTDNSLEIAKKVVCKYHHFNITLITQRNFGLSKTRNNGIKKSKGDYLFFFDSDDRLEKNSLDLVISYIEKYNYTVFSYNYYILNYKGKRRKILIKNKSNIEATIDSIPNLLSNAWRYICKRDFIVKNSIYFEENRLCEDIVWCTKLFLNIVMVGAIHIYIYEYKKNRPNSIMSNNSYKRLNDALHGIEKSITLVCNSKISKNRKQILMNSLKDIYYFNVSQIPLVDSKDFIKIITKAQTLDKIFENPNRIKDKFLKIVYMKLGFEAFIYILYHAKKIRSTVIA